MNTEATRSCMNYSTAYKLGKGRIKQFNTMQVVGPDGSDLGAVGTLECKITIGGIEVDQTFIVCRHLRRHVILGTDFAKENQAGVSWTKQGTRVLSVKGVARQEVEEDELGIPVTTKYHVKVPLRYSVNGPKIPSVYTSTYISHHTVQCESAFCQVLQQSMDQQ